MLSSVDQRDNRRCNRPCHPHPSRYLGFHSRIDRVRGTTVVAIQRAVVVGVDLVGWHIAIAVVVLAVAEFRGSGVRCIVTVIAVSAHRGCVVAGGAGETLGIVGYAIGVTIGILVIRGAGAPDCQISTDLMLCRRLTRRRLAYAEDVRSCRCSTILGYRQCRIRWPWLA